MNSRMVICSILLSLVVSSQALALKALVKMKPPLEGGDFALKMKSLKGVGTRFTITRDPAKAHQPSDPALTLVRGATLSVYNEKGLAVGCDVAPRQDNSGKLVYQFEIENELARRSTFTIEEIDAYKDKSRPPLLGGGCFYRFSLIDFIDPDHEQKEPQKRVKAAQDRLEKELRDSTIELPDDKDSD